MKNSTEAEDASVVFPLHKSPISEVIIHCSEKQMARKSSSEGKSVCMHAACSVQNLL